MKKNIVRRDYQQDSLDSFNHLHPLLRRVYAARQVKSEQELERELSHLVPYQSLLGIEKAAKYLAEAIQKNQKIVVIGDFDADGATSTAVAVRALRQFGATQVNFLVPNRFEYGYGLTPEIVEVAAEMYFPDVIITVDNGIANHAGVLAAKEKGIRVIVTDHHLAANTLPAADVIVNPNQPDDLFPSKNLAGVGVIFYVMLALRKELAQSGWFEEKKLPEPNMSRLLDLVALGTVADLVQLDHNNRILVHQGLRRIRAGQCVPGIIALLELAGRESVRVSATDLGFIVASRLNAAGRLDDMSLGIECLLSDDSARARELARVLDQMNDERKSIEKDMQKQALDALNKLSASLEGLLPRGVCLFDENWHQGVIGILAARIKDRFHRPVIVFAPGQEGELKGSARSITGLHIRDALAVVDVTHPDLILKFGGHSMAAGLTIRQQDLDKFSKAFNEAVSARVTEADLKHQIHSDGELDTDDFNLEVAMLIRDAGPWGQAFPEPLFDGVFHIVEQRLVGDKHLKMRLAKDEKILDGIAFFVDTKEWPNHRCQKIQAAYRLDINEYKGKRNIQLIIEYLEALND